MLTEGQYTKRKSPDVRAVARSLAAAPAGGVEAWRIAANIAELPALLGRP